MKISDKGIELIKHFEGLQLTAYRDSVNVLTIGYGHTGKDVKEGMKIDIFDAEILLKNDIAKFEQSVNNLVKVEITQGMFDALVSFCYNLGADALRKSTLLRLLNTSSFDNASAQFVLWTKAGGRELPGLVARREAEQAMFLGVDLQ